VRPARSSGLAKRAGCYFFGGFDGRDVGFLAADRFRFLRFLMRPKILSVLAIKLLGAARSALPQPLPPVFFGGFFFAGFARRFVRFAVLAFIVTILLVCRAT
jgi:hypothetical protein